jgi:hypothetical protein
LQDFSDGLDKTILVVEAGEAVPWTKPDELPFGPDVPLPMLGRGHGFQAVMADTTVAFINEKVSATTCRALITRNGIKPVRDDW